MEGQAVVVPALCEGHEILDRIYCVIIPEFTDDVALVCLYLDFCWQNAIASVLRFS